MTFLEVLRKACYLVLISIFLEIPFYYINTMNIEKPPFDDCYARLYKTSIENPDKFWSEVATSMLIWNSPFEKTTEAVFEDGQTGWFMNGKLNACFNCVDRHAAKNLDKIAILWVGDNPDAPTVSITYGQLKSHVCKLANWLRKVAGIRKGDTVTIYMPMIPEAIYSMLACARIGAIHNVVFGGFSAASLRERIIDSNSKVVVSADYGYRGGKLIDMKSNIVIALKDMNIVEHTLMYFRQEKSHELKWHFWNELEDMSEDHVPENMDSNDPLFMLYTSGSTGKPKGIVHGTGGYLTYATFTTKTVFAVEENDKIATFADVGWITGHSYIVYGPLSNGITTLVYEGIPTYPAPDRFWSIIESHKITQMYTAPTVIRMLKKYGLKPFEGKDLSSLKVIGSVGEPINSDAWIWYNNNVGQNRASVVDTYWQTETGGHIVAPIPGITSCKPGSATFPLYGIVPAVVNPENGEEINDIEAHGVLCIKKPWPGMAKSIWGDHKRFTETYLKPFSGFFYTGDRVYRDRDGYFWIRGRADDVINTSAHRLSTAEIENASCKCIMVAEAAALGRPDDIVGETIWIFCVVKGDYQDINHRIIEKDVIESVRNHIGPVATPRGVIIVSDLPKTRSGKIMRRILRKLLVGDYDNLGDISTLNHPLVIEEIKEKLAAINNRS